MWNARLCGQLGFHYELFVNTNTFCQKRDWQLSLLGHMACIVWAKAKNIRIQFQDWLLSLNVVQKIPACISVVNVLQPFEMALYCMLVHSCISHFAVLKGNTGVYCLGGAEDHKSCVMEILHVLILYTTLCIWCEYNALCTVYTMSTVQ